MLKLPAPFKYILIWFVLFVSFINHAEIFNNRVCVKFLENIILHKSIMVAWNFLDDWLLDYQGRVDRSIIGVRMVPAINEVAASRMLIGLDYLI